MAPRPLEVYIRGVRAEADESEKIELSLQQRQVAILAASALILLGVVFALGVMVGRQLASASLAAPVQPPAGDLRALDAERPPKIPPKPVAAPAVAAEPATEVAQAEAPDAAAPAPAAETPLPAHAPPVTARAAAPSNPVHPATATAQAPSPAAPPTPDEIDDDSSDDEAPGEKTTAVVPAPPKPVTVAAPKDNEGPLPPLPEHLGKFTVQFGATQDRKDAQRIESRAKALGMKPYIVVAHLQGKGTWYRLRAGAFDSRDEAVTYQKDVDRELKVHSAVMPTN